MTHESAVTPQRAASVLVGPMEEPEPASAWSLRGAFRLLVATGSGKAGLALFLGLLALSVYVVITFPGDFGRTR
jgi:hypothetical protein